MNPSSGPDFGVNNREFVRLLAENELRLAGYIHALVPAWHDAEDILQNTKLRLWEQFGDYRPEEDFAGWAFTVAGFLIKEYRRRRERQKVYFSDELLKNLSQRLSATSVWDDRTSALVECVKRLNSASRRLLRVFCTERRKIKDIAADLGQTPAAAYQSLSRIRRGLLDCVKNRLREGDLP